MDNHEKYEVVREKKEIKDKKRSARKRALLVSKKINKCLLCWNKNVII